MPFQPTNDIHKALITQLLGEDAELQQLAREFVREGMKATLEILRRGDLASRAAIARSLAAPITKAITDVSTDDTPNELAQDFHAMMAEWRGEWSGDDDGEAGDAAAVVQAVKIPGDDPRVRVKQRTA